MTQTAETLYAMWQSAHHRPAWLSLLVERFALDAEDEAHMSDTEDAFLRAMRNINNQWRRGGADRIRQFRDDVDKEWAKERRTEYLGQEIRNLDQEIAAVGQEHPDGTAQGESTRIFNRLCVHDLEQRRSRLSWELRALSRPGQSNGLEPLHLDRARAFPLERLVETRRGMMLCPLHEDRHPSMLVKKGFGYCFSCGGYLDSIGYLMQVKGLRFREAVEALQ